MAGIDFRHRRLLAILGAAAALVIAAGAAHAAEPIPIPRINLGVEPAESPAEVAVALQIIFLLTILTLAPSIIIMLTSFTRIIIILSLTRSALGTQQMPPNQVLVGLALFLTFFIMAPVGKNIYEESLRPYMDQQVDHVQALRLAERPIRRFMFAQTRRSDLHLFVSMAVSKGSMEPPTARADVPTWVLIPAFIISELRSAFQMGFVIFLPFLVIDMVVASTLMSMGMMMLPPIMISLPFKILLFVMVNGWALIAESIVRSFR